MRICKAAALIERKPLFGAYQYERDLLDAVRKGNRVAAASLKAVDAEVAAKALASTFASIDAQSVLSAADFGGCGTAGKWNVSRRLFSAEL